MSARLADIEEALQDHLRARFAPVDVRLFPDDPRAYTLQSQHGALLISYEGRRWSDPAAPEPRRVVQVRYSLTVVQRSLRARGAHLGALDLIEEAAAHVFGFAAGPFVFQAVADEFVDQREGVWFYAVQLQGDDQTRLRLP